MAIFLLEKKTADGADSTRGHLRRSWGTGTKLYVSVFRFAITAAPEV